MTVEDFGEGFEGNEPDFDLESVAAAFDPDTEVWDCYLVTPPGSSKRYLVLIPEGGQRSDHSMMQRIEPEEFTNPQSVRFRPGTVGTTDRAVAGRNWLRRARQNGWVTTNHLTIRSRFSCWDDLMVAAVARLARAI